MKKLSYFNFFPGLSKRACKQAPVVTGMDFADCVLLGFGEKIFMDGIEGFIHNDFCPSIMLPLVNLNILQPYHALKSDIHKNEE